MVGYYQTTLDGFEFVILEPGEYPPTPAARPQPPSSPDDDRDRSDDDRPSQE